MRPEVLLAFVIFLCVVAATLLFAQRYLRRVVTYALGADEIGVQVFGWSFVRIPFHRIVEIRQLSDSSPITDLVGGQVWSSGRLGAVSMVNRVAWGSALLIIRRGSLFGRIVITPDDPERYLSAFEAWTARRGESLPADGRA